MNPDLKTAPTIFVAIVLVLLATIAFMTRPAPPAPAAPLQAATETINYWTSD